MVYVYSFHTLDDKINPFLCTTKDVGSIMFRFESKDVPRSTFVPVLNFGKFGKFSRTWDSLIFSIPFNLDQNWNDLTPVACSTRLQHKHTGLVRDESVVVMLEPTRGNFAITPIGSEGVDFLSSKRLLPKLARVTGDFGS